MTTRLWPLARMGAVGVDPLDRSDRSLPLAGSASVWFRSLRLLGDAKAEITVADLNDDQRQRLATCRAPICGLSMDHPRIMGILNVTPDSFSDGGDLATVEAAVARAHRMAEEADILDIGGESTRPGADEVSVATEIDRTAPVIRAIREAGIATPISIDTRKAAVARAALAAGADMVNDVTAGRFDTEMLPLVAEAGVPVCLMHSVADPKTMQDRATYDDVVAEVLDHLAARIEAARAAGIPQGHIITDPGIGFGKTVEHNLRLLRHLSAFHDLGCAVLLGASRKRFIGTLGNAPEAKDRMAGSLAVSLHAIAQGVQFLRVHDTFETRQAMSLHSALNGATNT